MAGALVDRSWRSTVPERVESDLAALWREHANAASPVARAVMSNLVVFRDRVAPADADPAAVIEGLPLEEVAARHPSRMIVLEHCRDAEAATPFAAGVGVLTFGPPHACYGVELIVVRAACPDASLLSILRRFVRGDLPTTVWWTEDVSTTPPLEPFIEVGRQLLYDSRRWQDARRGAAALWPVVEAGRIDPADLNWRRLAPMRSALAQAVAGVSFSDLDAVRLVPAPGEEALAWLCAGWLRAGPRGAAAAAVTVDRPSGATGSDALLTVSTGPLTATLTPRQCSVDGAGAPLILAARVETEPEAIAAELRALARDASLAGALAALANWG
jgi:hypothetical protein